MKTTYGELKNGDVIFIQGYKFEVTALRNYLVSPAERGAIGPARVCVRFEGKAVGASDIKNTAYDGGTYGAWAEIPCTIERAA